MQITNEGTFETQCSVLKSYRPTFLRIPATWVRSDQVYKNRHKLAASWQLHRLVLWHKKKIQYLWKGHAFFLWCQTSITFLLPNKKEGHVIGVKTRGGEITVRYKVDMIDQLIMVGNIYNIRLMGLINNEWSVIMSGNIHTFAISEFWRRHLEKDCDCPGLNV